MHVISNGMSLRPIIGRANSSVCGTSDRVIVKDGDIRVAIGAVRSGARQGARIGYVGVIDNRRLVVRR